MNFLLLMITILDMLVSAATSLSKLLVLVLIVHQCQIIQYAKDIKVVISLVLRKPGRQ